jgi:hypothetical protein
MLMLDYSSLSVIFSFTVCGGSVFPGAALAYFPVGGVECGVHREAVCVV